MRNNNEGLLGNFLKEYGFLVKGKNMNQDGKECIDIILTSCCLFLDKKDD